MALTSFDYIQTRNEIISGALRIVGALEPDQSPTAEMLEQGIKALQLLVKSWANEGLFLWGLEISELGTVAAQVKYTSADLDSTSTAPGLPIGIEKAWIEDGNNDLQIECITYSRYQDFLNKVDTIGRPQFVAFRPAPTPEIYFYPAPDAIYGVKILGVYPMEDFDSASGSGDFPAHFQRALKYGLAEDLFDEYPGPMNERQFIQTKAAELLAKAKRTEMPRETTNEVEGLF
jgi:hypothetical protein